MDDFALDEEEEEEEEEEEDEDEVDDEFDGCLRFRSADSLPFPSPWSDFVILLELTLPAPAAAPDGALCLDRVAVGAGGSGFTSGSGLGWGSGSGSISAERRSNSMPTRHRMSAATTTNSSAFSAPLVVSDTADDGRLRVSAACTVDEAAAAEADAVEADDDKDADAAECVTAPLGGGSCSACQHRVAASCSSPGSERRTSAVPSWR